LKRQVKRKRSKEGKPEEFYRGQIRSLKKEIKNLRHQIKHLERTEPRSPREPDEDDIRLEECTQCGKGFLSVLNMVGRTFKTCNLCGWRSKALKD
jgi:hypothetical protein